MPCIFVKDIENHTNRGLNLIYIAVYYCIVIFKHLFSQLYRNGLLMSETFYNYMLIVNFEVFYFHIAIVILLHRNCLN